MSSISAVKPKTTNIDGLVIKKKFKFINSETSEVTLYHEPVCYVIRERLTPKDSIYLIFRVNCSLIVLNEIVRLALGLDKIEQIPELLQRKINDETKRTIYANDDVRRLFIKIYGSDVTLRGFKYKYVSTGKLFSGSLAVDLENLAQNVNPILPISTQITPDCVHTLTKSEQYSINNADAIMERLKSKLSAYPYETFKCMPFVIPPDPAEEFEQEILVDMLLIRDLDYAYMLSSMKIKDKCDTTGSESETCKKIKINKQKEDTIKRTYLSYDTKRAIQFYRDLFTKKIMEKK
jgi:hypothetical protein